jgi:hypothetical protein
MRYIINILTFLSFVQLCFGQEKSFYVPTYRNGDTTLWYKWQQENFEKAGLKKLTNTNDTLHFRFSSETQVIDIWTTDFLTFMGTLTNFTSSCDFDTHKRKKEKADKFFSETKSLDTVTARKVYDLFLEKSIFEIPPQDQIKGWSNGKDGITYFIEKSTSKSYSFKDYWTPSAFKNKVEEANRFNEMTERLEELLNLRHSFGQFINSLPYGTYRAGGIVFISTSKKK